MTRASFTLAGRALAAAVVFTLASGPVLADKGGKHGHGDKHDKYDRHDDDHGHERREARVGRYFDDRDRQAVRVYYVDQGRAGHCPPGLAKKHNGCMPPGQAKKWEVGHALPSTVRYYDVPAPLVVKLGPPAPGYRYVRVDDNILLLAVGTRMVVDAITGLGR